MNTQPLRVLLTSPVGQHGGAEQVFLSLAKYLPQWNVTPVFACLRPGPLADAARGQGTQTCAFRAHRYRNALAVLRGARWLARTTREAQIDLIHCNHAAHLYGSLAARWANVPEVWHIYDYPYRRDMVDHLAERLPTSYIVFTLSRVESGYPRLHRYPRSVIPPACVEPDRLRAFPPQPNIRACYGLPDGPLFVTVARLQPHKGHRFLIEAVPAILQAYPQAVFAIVGKASGPQQESYRQELLAQCARLGVTDRVRFVGFVPDADLVALYRDAAAVIHPATSEGFGPLTLLEALALGTPVIAARADGPRELIAEGKTGLLVPTGDSAALAQAAIRLLGSPSLAETLRREGGRYSECFRVERMVEQTVEVYRQVAEQHKRRRAAVGGRS
ncbi:MAG TPA: glycosyltransferase family 4 protein [Chthonomonadaceae bacterium]|nr:glycosyltransferase family 4 protein [Chthonomonadaceae bacterium]